MSVKSAMNAIADAIRAKTGGTELLSLEQMPEAINAVYDEGFEAGKQAEYDAFWDAYQQNGERTNYTNAFSIYWDSNSFKPKYSMKPINAYQMFYQSKIGGDLRNVAEIDFSECQDFTYAFGTTKFTHIGVVDTTNCTALTVMLLGASQLEVLELLVIKDDGTTTASSTFTNCYKLKEIRIKGKIGQNGFNFQTCTLLSHDSLINIFDALQDKSEDTSGTVWQLVIGGDNRKKLTAEELEIAQNKGWVVK